MYIHVRTCVCVRRAASEKEHDTRDKTPTIRKRYGFRVKRRNPVVNIGLSRVDVDLFSERTHEETIVATPENGRAHVGSGCRGCASRKRKRAEEENPVGKKKRKKKCGRSRSAHSRSPFAALKA